MIKSLIFVGLGGFLGSAGRYLIAQLMLRFVPGFSPIGTLTVNLLGCFILGFMIHTATRLDKEYFLLLTTGFCGGFTTFSTFGVENLNLFLNQQYSTAALYISISLTFGILAAGLGWYIGKTLMA